MDENRPRRRWLNVGIRDLLWAMVVVGLAVGWWQTNRQLQSVKRRLDDIEGMGRAVVPPRSNT